jgi:hypothetical protein
VELGVEMNLGKSRLNIQEIAMPAAATPSVVAAAPADEPAEVSLFLMSLYSVLTLI